MEKEKKKEVIRDSLDVMVNLSRDIQHYDTLLMALEDPADLKDPEATKKEWATQKAIKIKKLVDKKDQLIELLDHLVDNERPNIVLPGDLS